MLQQLITDSPAVGSSSSGLTSPSLAYQFNTLHQPTENYLTDSSGSEVNSTSRRAQFNKIQQPAENDTTTDSNSSVGYSRSTNRPFTPQQPAENSTTTDYSSSEDPLPYFESHQSHGFYQPHGFDESSNSSFAGHSQTYPVQQQQAEIEVSSLIGRNLQRLTDWSLSSFDSSIRSIPNSSEYDASCSNNADSESQSKSLLTLSRSKRLINRGQFQFFCNILCLVVIASGLGLVIFSVSYNTACSQRILLTVGFLQVIAGILTSILFTTCWCCGEMNKAKGPREYQNTAHCLGCFIALAIVAIGLAVGLFFFLYLNAECNFTIKTNTV